MLKCLLCGKLLSDSSTSLERMNAWHARCCKQFFGTNVLPDIELNEEVLHSLALATTARGFTVPGVQKKLSLHLTHGSKNQNPRLTLVNYPTGYILKPQTREYAHLPEAEHAVMSMAKAVGIQTVDFALLKQTDGYAYITKRIDRNFQKKSVQMLAMEDFCQLDGRLTADKYRGSYERCGRIIAKYSLRPGLDLTELYLRVVFSYLVGNSDMHLKNFSLIETAEGSGVYYLSAAYDMLPVNIILPEDQEQLALTINGKKRNITRNDFLKLADNYGIQKKVAERLIAHLLDKQELLLKVCRESYMPDDMKSVLEELICARASVLHKKM